MNPWIRLNGPFVYGADKEEHDQCLDGLKLNRAKCHFRQTEIQFFGHIISSNSVKPNSGKVEANHQIARSYKCGEASPGAWTDNLCGQIASWSVYHAVPASKPAQKGDRVVLG